MSLLTGAETATHQFVFTGIVLGAFSVVERQELADALRLVVQLDAASAAGLVPGASVAVAGVCLTAVQLQAERVAFDVVRETVTKTRLGELQVGERVNIERSLRAGDEIGGHNVSGHVVGTATVARVEISGWQHQVWFAVNPAWLDFILHKGFIALEGCSLTVGEVTAQEFSVNLIPETLRRTTLGELEPGSRVNIELDPLTVATVTTVKRFLATRKIVGEA